ncbi:MAG: response regulator transcription factor [Armatimonadota bacterium]
MMRPTILVVDDDAATRKMIDTALRAAGFDVVDAGSAAEAIDAIARTNPDVVLLDLILPDADGVDVCRRLRQCSDVSIIMVTGRRDLSDRLAGLDAGADDYVTKPLSMGELVARVRAVLRRREMREQEQASEMRWGEITLLPGQRIASVGDRQARLSEIEAGILRVLIEAQGASVTAQQLGDAVWGAGEGDPMVLRTHITNLRHKLEEDPERPRHVLTGADGRYRLA